MKINDDTTRAENAFLADIAASGSDWVPRAIYADWLDDRGRTDEAEALRLAIAQAQAARDAAALSANVASLWPSTADMNDLSDHQKVELARATVRPFGLLVGGPGTGKTRCLSSLVAALLAARHRVRVASPTGKAAVRCAQVLRDRGIGTVRPTTIHQLLEVRRNGRDGRGWGFQRNASYPLAEQFLIFDEMSMADCPIVAAALAATTPRHHVLFIGDIGQLPPVGHGSPMRDLLAAGLPTGYLTDIRRNAGMIVEACDAIRRRSQFRVAVKFDRAAGLNLVHIEANKPEEQLARLGEVLDRMRASGSFNPRDDVQVLTAVNDEKKSPLARTAINKQLQARLNPTGNMVGGYRLGDKIICLRNHWNADGDYLANGDIGIVSEIEGHVVTATFPDPLRTARLSFGNKEAIDAAHRDYALAWAITGHKAQGSEWRCVIALIDTAPAARHVASREYWYTVLSRARELTITIGRNNAMQWQARRPRLERRKTFLAELLAEHGRAKG